MDIHTSEAIGTLRTDLRRVEMALGMKIDARVRASASALRVEIGELRGVHRSEVGDLRSDMDKVRSEVGELWADTGQFRVAMRTDMTVLRDDIRMIAEGAAALDRKVESFRPPGRVSLTSRFCPLSAVPAWLLLPSVMAHSRARHRHRQAVVEPQVGPVRNAIER
jgi:hypothetical protein